MTAQRVVQGLGILSAVLMLVLLVMIRTPVQPKSVKATPVVDRTGKSPGDIVGGFVSGLVHDGPEVAKQYVQGELPDLPKASSWSMYKEGSDPTRYMIVANTGQEFLLTLGKDERGWIVKKVQPKPVGQLQAAAGSNESRGSTGSRELEGTPGTGTLDPGYGSTSGTASGDERAARAVVEELIKHCASGRMDRAAQCIKGNPTGYATIEQYLAMTGSSWARDSIKSVTKVDDETFHVATSGQISVVGRVDGNWTIVGLKR